LGGNVQCGWRAAFACCVALASLAAAAALPSGPGGRRPSGVALARQDATGAALIMMGSEVCDGDIARLQQILMPNIAVHRMGDATRHVWRYV